LLQHYARPHHSAAAAAVDARIRAATSATLCCDAPQHLLHNQRFCRSGRDGQFAPPQQNRTFARIGKRREVQRVCFVLPALDLLL